MIFDVIVIAAIIIFTVIGYFKGFISQFSTFAGILVAYFLSPKWVPLIQEFMRDLLPFSYIVCDMFSRLFIGIIIFFVIKLAGKFVEFVFVSKVREIGTFNSWGGCFFGFLKSLIVLFLVMIFVTLIPSSLIKKRFSGLEKSLVYMLCKKYNPVINPQAMENLRRLSELSKNEKKLETINKSVVYEDYLKTKNLDNPLGNPEALKSFQKGDTEDLKKSGLFKLLGDKDFMDFIHGEKYYKQEEEKPSPPQE